MEIINATPHPISIYDADTPDTLPAADAPAPLRTIAPSGTLARAAQTRASVGELDDVLVGTSAFGAVEGLPDPAAGADRPDLLCQECGGTMTLESSYENEARGVVHQYWCETCRVLRDVV